VRYGLVQSLGTQKVFFERPRVNNAAAPVTLPQPPKLADMGALLNAAGVFPGLADSFDFKTLKALSASEGNLGFSETFPIGAGEKKALLANLGAIQVQIEYHDEHETDVPPPVTQPTMATITVDPDPNAALRWSLFLSRVCFAVPYNNRPLISIFADVKADAKTAPTVANINVRYEGILGALQSIFTNIQQVARFLPGGQDAGLKVGFSQGHLTVRNAFALPTLPLGTGQITDVAVDMGSVSLNSSGRDNCCAVARQKLANLPEGSRIVIVEGDVFKDALPAGHDALIVANTAHVFSVPHNIELMRKIRAGVPPGARLLLVDLWTDPSHTQPGPAALISGEFLVISGEGQAYSEQEADSWLGQTGWKKIEKEPLAGPTSLIVAEAV
jgi:hypothetical protein